MHLPSFVPYAFRITASASNPFGIEGFYAGNFALSWHGIGLALEGVKSGSYQRVALAAAVSRTIGRTKNIGITFRTANETAGKLSKFSYDMDIGLGAQYRNATFGITAYSILGRYRQMLSFFSDLNINPVQIGVELAQSRERPMFIRGYIGYKINNSLSFKLGSSSDPRIWSFGAEFSGPLKINYVFRNYIEIGVTHVISVTMDISR